MRDFALVAGKALVDQEAADDALNRLEVDAKGLDAMDRRYLRCIAEHYGRGHVGVDTMAAPLSEERAVTEAVTEP